MVTLDMKLWLLKEEKNFSSDNFQELFKGRLIEGDFDLVRKLLKDSTFWSLSHLRDK
jgi:hypothetical protein